MEQGQHGTGPTRRQSTCEKDCARAEMDQEQSKHDCAREQDGNKVTLHQKRVRQRRESNRYLQDTWLTSEMLQMTAWPSSLSPEPSTYMPHVVTLDIRLIFPDILLRKAYSAHAYF